MVDDQDEVLFDDTVTLALAQSVPAPAPRPEVRAQLLARLVDPPVPPGFAFRFATEPEWMAHPVPGIRMKVLSLNQQGGYATLLLDVAPGTRFPPHFHEGAEECYVLSGSLFTCGRQMQQGDFLHADGDTSHGELWTENGCRVLLVTPPEDFMVSPTPAG